MNFFVLPVFFLYDYKSYKTLHMLNNKKGKILSSNSK